MNTAESHPVQPALLSWWGGFFGGPLLAVVVYATNPDDVLARSHGRAAAIVWSVVLAFWAPLSAWVILLGRADPSVLVTALPFVVIISVGSCAAGTFQAYRGRSLLGRRLSPPD